MTQHASMLQSFESRAKDKPANSGRWLQRSALSATAHSELSVAPPMVHEVLSSPGQPLDAHTRQLMQSRFEHDFSGVRIHTDEQAAESSRAVNANAFTVGQDIVFDSGRFAPRSRSGTQLLAHELTHVVQQSRRSGASPDAVSESAAEHVASTFHTTTGRLQIGPYTGLGIARQKASQAKSPPLNLAPYQERGRTFVLLNGVAVVESDAPASAVSTTAKFEADRLLILVDIPEGKTGFVIEGPATHAALSKLAAHYRIEIREASKPSPPPSGELDNTLTTGASHVTQQTFEGHRPKSPAAKKPPPPPPTATPPKPTPPPSSSPPSTHAPIQFGPPPSPRVDLNLPPSAKYGKPMTDRERAKENINRIVADAMAGRPALPPPIAGLDNKSALEIIEQAVIDAVKPLIRGLPKDVQDFLNDKIKSAVEEGLDAAAEAAVDSLKIDDTAKSSIKKALEAARQMKPAPKTR